jgi:glutamate-1-semialdehyde 2,1-aminomutase
MMDVFLESPGLEVERTVDTHTSRTLHERAERHSPKGCAAGDGRFYPPYPIYFTKALGARLWDADGHEYIDFQGAPGPHVLGHGHPEILHAMIDSMQTEGIFIGQSHPKQVELAELFCSLVPCADMVMFCGGGGSDPIFHSIRLSRAYTGRSKLLKLEGGFHGWHDSVMVSMNPKPEQLGPYDSPIPVPNSAGISQETIANTIIVHANDEAMLERVVSQEKGNIACMMVEPVMHGVGVLRLTESYLSLMRQLCDEYKIVLIFDEMLTGFRHNIGGAQRMFRIVPDLAIFGKAWTNGAAVLSAIAGKRELMSSFTPLGQVRLSGSYGANLMGVTAALATMKVLRRDDGAVYESLFRLGDLMREGINTAAQRVGVKARCHNFGSVWVVYPFDTDFQNYREMVTIIHPDKHTAFATALSTWLINNGIFVAPITRARAFLSAAHTEEDVERAVTTIESFFGQYKGAINSL